MEEVGRSGWWASSKGDRTNERDKYSTMRGDGTRPSKTARSVEVLCQLQVWRQCQSGILAGMSVQFSSTSSRVE